MKSYRVWAPALMPERKAVTVEAYGFVAAAQKGAAKINRREFWDGPVTMRVTQGNEMVDIDVVVVVKTSFVGRIVAKET